MILHVDGVLFDCSFQQWAEPFKSTGFLYTLSALTLKESLLHAECIYWLQADVLLRLIICVTGISLLIIVGEV